MFKRNVALLIAGGLLSAAAAADQGAFPSSVNETSIFMTPALSRYLEQRAASTDAPRVAVGQDTFPSSVNETSIFMTPALSQYLASVNRDTSPAPWTVKIDGSTRQINVEHLQTVKIENDKGESFVWTADTLGSGADNFPLKAVAPQNFAAGATRVFLSHPHEHMLHN